METAREKAKRKKTGNNEPPPPPIPTPPRPIQTKAWPHMSGSSSSLSLSLSGRGNDLASHVKEGHTWNKAHRQTRRPQFCQVCSGIPRVPLSRRRRRAASFIGDVSILYLFHCGMASFFPLSPPHALSCAPPTTPADSPLTLARAPHPLLHMIQIPSMITSHDAMFMCMKEKHGHTHHKSLVAQTLDQKLCVCLYESMEVGWGLKGVCSSLSSGRAFLSLSRVFSAKRAWALTG